MEILERDGVLKELQAVLEQVAAGQGRVALVSGEAGIGKTSLVELFLSRQPAAWRRLRGACDSLITPRPLGPLYDIANQTQGQLLQVLNSTTNRQEIFYACLEELGRGLQIVVIEDIHWADDATLDLLKFLGRRIQHISALLILTYRDDELGYQHPLRLILGDFAASERVHYIQPSRLTEEAVRRLAAGKHVDAAALYSQTGGNPFFVTEVLAGGGSIPATVRDAVLARAACLSPMGWSVLEAAAIIGTRVEPWLLAQMTGAQAGATEECISSGMLQAQEGMLVFRHELARQTILGAISPHEELLLHQRVMVALRDSPATRHDLARLAHHAGVAHDGVAVLTYAPAAGRQAHLVHAHREAAAQFELALRFAGGLPLEERAALLEAYAMECNIIDQREKGLEARRKALELWRQAGNIKKQGENLALMMVMYFGIGQTAEADRVSRQAVELLETLPPSKELAMAYRIQGTVRMFIRDNAEAIHWSEKAIVLAEQFGDDETLSGAYNAIGSAWMISDYKRGREYLERSLAIAQAAGLELHVTNAYNNLSSASGEVYRYDQADRYLAEGIAYASERDQDVSAHYMLAWQALAHLHLGRWNKAAECASAVLAGPGISAISRIMALLALGKLRARRGDPGAWEALDEALSLAEDTESLQRIAPVRAARAEAAWLEGDAARTTEEARASYDMAVRKEHGWFVGELGYWRQQAGEQLELPVWAATPFAMQIAGDWSSAAAAWGEVGCIYERARALAGGDEAAQLEAVRIFEQLGARPALERLKRALRASKVRSIPRGPRPATRQNPFGLTAREMEVLAQVGKGLNNLEIAARLSLSPRTVEHHISAILTKLGVQSRAQAVAIALGNGLVPGK